MLRLICSTISIAAVLGVLVVGCGSDSPATPTAGTGTAGSAVKGAGGKTGGAAGSVTVPTGQGGTVQPQGQGGTTPTGAGGTTDTPKPCGNGVLDDGEECDGDLFPAGLDTCASVIEGTDGTLTCNEECICDASQCLPVDATPGDQVYTDV
jgi:hypothetical protein